MRLALSTRFVEKSEAALVSAIEIFNKPSFRYREETFALLAINAWELLLKARLIKASNNDPRSIRIYEPRQTQSGRVSKKRYLKRSRSGAPLTLSLNACVLALDGSPTTRLSPEVKANLEALIAIRDSAAHFITASGLLSRQVLELASASVRNFITLCKLWFDRDLSESLSLVLPLSLLSEREVESVVVTPGESQLVKYLQSLAAAEPEAGSPFSVAIRVQVKFERSKLSSASKVQVTNDPDAVRVVLTEQDVRDRYPWDYKTLGKVCTTRYRDFRQDAKYHSLRKPLGDNPKFVHSRYLDPANPKSGKKDFYSAAILDLFDKHYERV